MSCLCGKHPPSSRPRGNWWERNSRRVQLFMGLSMPGWWHDRARNDPSTSRPSRSTDGLQKLEAVLGSSLCSCWGVFGISRSERRCWGRVESSLMGELPAQELARGLRWAGHAQGGLKPSSVGTCHHHDVNKLYLCCLTGESPTIFNGTFQVMWAYVALIFWISMLNVLSQGTDLAFSQ